MTRVVFTSNAFIQAVSLTEWTADATIATVFRQVLSVALHVHEGYINITSVASIDTSIADPFHQHRKLTTTTVLSVSYTSSLPVPVTTTERAVFDRCSAYLSSPTFAEYFYFAMQASPLFRANEATAYVNAAGGMSLVASSYVTVIAKSPGPTGQPTGSPTKTPSGQPTNTPTGPPVVIPVVPLLSPAQVQILTISGIALGAVLTLCASAYLLFFRCYLVDRHKAASKALGKKTAFILQLPAVVVKEVVEDKGPARILNKKERAKLRETEREKRDQLAHSSPASPSVAVTGEVEGEDDEEELDGAAGGHVRAKAGLWSCFSRAAPIKPAPRARDSHRIYVAPDSHDEEHKDGWNDSGGKERKTKKKPKSKRMEAAGGPETDEEDDEEAWHLSDPRPLHNSDDASGSRDSWNVQFDLTPPSPSPSRASKATPIKIKQINPQQLTRKEKIMHKKARDLADKLRALERSIQLGESVEWSDVNQEIDNIAVSGGKALTQEERRKRAREANQALEANARREMAIDGVKAAYQRRQDQAVVHLVTPQVSRRHEFPDAETSQSLFDTDVDGRRKEVVVRRLQQRLAWREARMRAGEEDVVLKNSGPPEGIVPAGFCMAPVAPPELKLEALYHRRVMVQWNEDKARGWFLGIVCSTTTRPGFNFGVKYDKAETHNIEVDGIKTTMLGMEGAFAYGLHWVLLDPVDGVIAPVELPLETESLAFDDLL